MKHYDFGDRFRAMYDKAVSNFAGGNRGLATWFAPAEVAWLAENGISPQHLYDYAEDHHQDGEPGYDRALAIETVRRDYFLSVQGGRASGKALDESKLPGKAEAVRGITWLPRIIPKTKAKLRGELPPSLMYSCGGDRAFFRQHDIHPAEFMSLVWRHENEDAAIVDWVVRRSSAK